VENNLFSPTEDNDNNNSEAQVAPSLLSQFIASLSQPTEKKSANLNDSNEAETSGEDVFEFDEAKFRSLIVLKRAELENSKESERLREEISQLKDELESNRLKLNKAENKLKVCKINFFY
jgi:hypothetical protein